MAGGKVHAVPLRDIVQVIRVPEAAPVPLGPVWLAGLISHRGIVLPMVSLTLLLGHQAAAPTPQSRVLIAATGSAFLVEGLAADAPDAGMLDLAALLPDAGRAAGGPVARPVARPGGAEATAAAEERSHAMLGCMIAGQEYAFALEAVEEVAATPGGDHTDSIMWRGRQIPAVALRARLGGADGAAPARLAVVRLADGSCAAMLVDAFTGILRVPPALRHAMPPLLARRRPELDSICRLDGGARLVCVLSPDILLGARGGAAFTPPPATVQGIGTGEQLRFMITRVGAARFAVPLASVDEIVAAASLTQVPGAPALVDGVRNLRGGTLPVTDLRRRFGLGAGVSRAGGKILVCSRSAAARAGFLVDAVERIISVAPGDAGPAPALPGTQLISGVVRQAGGGVLPVLELMRLAEAGTAEAGMAEALAGLAA